MASDEDRMVEVVADAIVDHAWITESDSRRIAELVLEALTAAGWGDVRAAEQRGREAAIAELRSDAAFLDWRADPAVAHRHVSSYDRESCALFLEAQTKPVEGSDE